MTDLDRLSAFLASEGRPRVWSILVTILGDLGGLVEMQTCLALCSRIGVEEQAVRTAMSRLVKDGLVEGERTGRTSAYRFSVSALADYRAAAPLVYAAPKKVGSWRAALLPPAPDRSTLIDRLAPTHPFGLGDALLVWPSGSPWASDAERLAGRDVVWLDLPDGERPAWTTTHHAPRINTAMAALLVEVLGREGWQPPADPEEAAALRILALHFWRRLVLRYPPIHAPLAADIWPLPAAHDAIAAVYHRLGGAPDRFT
ncbi:PaaX family transcriptional regulator C-terminal domain-containing protein [Pseudaestuariivita atlantica]|uniref:PaaX-like N-terminal domain-containing protein n=1 Tax=Pseudaestuariivita atlantica TaxID=1317121 RepID=A0A0L1JPC2_9RHOB|nr:PaaX family transcriptional regulator C-terminal domain-containing protein [Pseudaestuariivita atlantica]KNG93263.1 hypothetical protein ATO11_12470 [Pseudaestuariivita atlantica]